MGHTLQAYKEMLLETHMIILAVQVLKILVDDTQMQCALMVQD